MFAGTRIGEEGAFRLPYGTDEEVRAWISRDPILRYKTLLLKRKLVGDGDLARIEADALATIATAFDVARSSPVAGPEAGLEDVATDGQPVPATQPFLQFPSAEVPKNNKSPSATAASWIFPSFFSAGSRERVHLAMTQKEPDDFAAQKPSEPHRTPQEAFHQLVIGHRETPA